MADITITHLEATDLIKDSRTTINTDLDTIVSAVNTAQENIGTLQGQMSGLEVLTGEDIGTFGDSANVPVITVNTKGQITAISQISLGTTFAAEVIIAQTAQNALANGISFQKQGNTSSGTGAVHTDSDLGHIEMWGWNGTAFSPGTMLAGRAAENWDSTHHGAYIAFSTVAKTTVSLTEKMRLSDAGNLIIASTTDNGRALQVTGNVSFARVGAPVRLTFKEELDGAGSAWGAIQVAQMSGYGGYLSFSTSPNSASLTDNAAEAFRVSHNQNVIIGALTDDGANKLQVTGNAKILGSGNGLIFQDATKQTTAAIPITSGVIGSLPSTPATGQIYIPTNSVYNYLIYNGASWDYYLGGKKVGIFPSIGSLTWVNQNSATFDNSKGYAQLTPVTASGGSTLLVASAPATPWTASVRLRLNTYQGNYFHHGICMRESSTGKFYFMGIAYVNGWMYFRGARWTDLSTLSTNVDAPGYGAIAQGQDYCLQLQNTGVNCILQYSTDGGLTYTPLITEAVGTFCTPNQIGVMANKGNSGTATDILTITEWTIS